MAVEIGTSWAKADGKNAAIVEYDTKDGTLYYIVGVEPAASIFGSIWMKKSQLQVLYDVLEEVIADTKE